jgi:hypothetical protein
LVRWLEEWGADEFSLAMLGIEGRDSPGLREIESRLAPHSLGVADREHLTARPRDEIVRPTPIWRLHRTTIPILHSIFTHGLFGYPASEDAGGWVEDPSLYRAGELVLSIVSHESEGMLRLPLHDYHRASAELGLILHAEGEWI